MSNAAPRGLGRGLGQLIQRSEPRPPSAPEPAAAPPPATTPNGSAEAPPEAAVNEHPVPEGSYFAELPIGSIRPNPRQPRTVFDEDELNELVESITEVGLLQPIVVRPLGEPGEDNAQYELVMGERRWRASQLAELPAIPAIVRRTEEADLLRDALLENLHRTQLNPLEEAAAYQQMLEDFGCSQEELAQRIKRSRPQISNTIRLLRLPPTVQRRVAAGVLSAGHARALLMVEDQGGQERLAQRVVAEGLSVRATEELVTLGDGTEETKPRTRERRATPGPLATEAADRLSDRLETRVRVSLGKTKGKITIDFASAEDMQRIVGLIEGR
ncbi:MAG TPA: ParB/RepB/Spo0J family partition protein [Microlunatus sp.]